MALVLFLTAGVGILAYPWLVAIAMFVLVSVVGIVGLLWTIGRFDSRTTERVSRRDRPGGISRQFRGTLVVEIDRDRGVLESCTFKLRLRRSIA